MGGENNVTMKEKALVAHSLNHGKIEIIGKVPLDTGEDLSLYYTPGVAYPCLAIKDNPELSYEYTGRGNSIAIITDGTRVLGLGKIGAEAAMPVMEGKSLLFKKFSGINAVPLVISATEEDEIVKFVKTVSPSFGGINIEDIESPKVFNVVKRLEEELEIPVFHDDRYGTAVVVLAAMKNALMLAGKRLGDSRIVINGAGSAGIGIAELLIDAGAKNLIMCDSRGIIYSGRAEGMNPTKEHIASLTNPKAMKGNLDDAARGADVLIGVSISGKFPDGMIGTMAEKPIVFALSNPDPEITYKGAREAGAFIIATGRSDCPNQINNYLVFPGVFKGLLSCRARRINNRMLILAGNAIAKSVGKSLSVEKIVPDLQDLCKKNVTGMVAAAVVAGAIETGVARVKADPKEVKRLTMKGVKRYSSIEKRCLRKKTDDTSNSENKLGPAS